MDRASPTVLDTDSARDEPGTSDAEAWAALAKFAETEELTQASPSEEAATVDVYMELKPCMDLASPPAFVSLLTADALTSLISKVMSAIAEAGCVDGVAAACALSGLHGPCLEELAQWVYANWNVFHRCTTSFAGPRACATFSSSNSSSNTG